ncbi:MAG: response regulator [SAR324 cluster bacterium]|uniref:Response regulator n=1 Tax=SAR324 cluster bacterium TaxID=2024889 RepID=A0A7X9FTE7_9DELT|nr:response regulator [SAR324 cluster bacterium]
MQKLKSLVIDPDAESRNRVRNALLDFEAFSEPESNTSLEESSRQIALGSFFDIVFISQRFPGPEITSFVNRCKNTKSGEDSTYIMILNTNEQSESAIRLQHAFGVDAFLLEPYSSEQLKEVVDFSFDIKQERAEVRQQVGLSLVIIDLIDQINLIAFLKSCGFSTARSMKRLKELCLPLKEVSGQSLDTYFNLVERLFTSAPFPTHFNPDEYHRGVTERVRERMERRIIRDLEEQRIAGNAPSAQLKEVIQSRLSETRVRVISHR